MKRVLLAVDGLFPSKNVLLYAVQFCRRARAELDILQIINPAAYNSRIQKIRRLAGKAGQILERALVIATFAEGNAHDAARTLYDESFEAIKEMVPEEELDDLQCRCIVKVGDPETEIVNYVNENRNVLVTFLDASMEAEQAPGFRQTIQSVKRVLRMPLVASRP